jgi:hypothetical protein
LLILQILASQLPITRYWQVLPWSGIMSTGRNSLPLSCGQTVSCTNCGTPHIIYPPTSDYVSTMLDPCARGDYQKSFFDCINSNKRNTFYWNKRHREDKYAAWIWSFNFLVLVMIPFSNLFWERLYLEFL